MTLPRLLTPGATVMITRRTLRRTCLLRSDRELTNLYIYCRALTARRFDIQVHAVMANPVAAGLVRAASEWPRLRTLPPDLGCATWTAGRAKAYFTAHDDAWPPEVSLRLVLPPAPRPRGPRASTDYA